MPLDFCGPAPPPSPPCSLVCVWAGDLKCGDVQQGEEWRVVTSVGAVGGVDCEGGGDAQGQGCAPLPHILEGQVGSQFTAISVGCKKSRTVL